MEYKLEEEWRQTQVGLQDDNVGYAEVRNLAKSLDDNGPLTVTIK